MNFTTPPPLQPGDTIGVMAPSSRVAPEALDAAQKFIEEKGYKVFIHPQSREALHQSAGTNAQKIAALHDLAADKTIKAVFFATGGNRALHILDDVDYALIAANPKIYMGFSDNTALLNAITARTGLITWHGPTFKRIPQNPQIDFNLSLLSGAQKEIPLPGARVFREGTAKGPLIGGNISLLQYLIHSGDLPDPAGAILFLEDCYEEWSRIDRDFCFFRRSGLLQKIGGLIIGQFTNMLDTGTPFGFTLDDIIAEHTAGLDIPILLDAPFGHGADLTALPIGATVTLENMALIIDG